MIVLISNALGQEHLKERLRSVGYASYKDRKAEWDSRLTENVERRRLNRDPDAYLAKLEQEWAELFC